MIRYKDECCGCATPGYPCTAPHCRNLNVKKLYCDKCNHEVDALYAVDNKELCEECTLEELMIDD